MVTVKEAREQERYDQGDVAKVLGISYSAYRNKEKGRSRFTVQEAIKFAELVKVPIGDIIFDINGAQT